MQCSASCNAGIETRGKPVAGKSVRGKAAKRAGGGIPVDAEERAPSGQGQANDFLPRDTTWVVP